ncbi:MAG: leucine-rich repeat protein, partial [Clostridia bacterium]|nr:leucine-rich repeat protein [Clostridia bacterium]
MSSEGVKAGTVVTVTAGDNGRRFVGWSFGAPYDEGGYIASEQREYTFRLSPDKANNGWIEIYPNYTDSNVYSYNTNGGSINLNSYNMQQNEYYTAGIEGNNVKVTLLDKYTSYAECASTFYDDGTFYRDGYVLKEYNTEPDGSGDSYSLGSKFYIETKNAKSVLYCIWEKETPKEDFNYTVIDMPTPEGLAYLDRWYTSGIRIDRYLKNDKKVVIPEYVDGLPVIAIGEGAFTYNSLSEIILPKTLQKVADNAFIGCMRLETMYFPNGLYEMHDEALDDASYTEFKHLIVNATVAPRNTTSTDGAFAVKLSRLLAAEDKKKIIVISGSSSYQGLSTDYMEALFNGEYEVINFGTTRPRPGLFYLEALSHYTCEGDVFVYAPENSAYMMGEKTLGWRFLYDLEGMNNLFRYVDISNYQDYFSSFTELNQTVIYTKQPRRYEDIVTNGYTTKGERVYTNKNGDFQHPYRDGYVGVASYVDTYYLTYNERIKSIYDGTWNDKDFQEANKDYTDPNNPTWTSIDRPELVEQMNMAIGKAKSSGAAVYFGFAPADADKLVDEAKNLEWLLAYDALILDLYEFDGILGSCTDYIYNHQYAYDCAFHLNNYGRTYRTYTLYTHIAEKVGITEINGIYSVGLEFEGCLFESGSDGTPVFGVDYLGR